jgi:hypothetical protein
MKKTTWLSWAEVIDSLRIVPRLFLAAWSTFTMYLGWYLVHWYTVQPANERGYEESVALIGIFTASLGMVKLIFDKYASTGRDWNSVPPTQ